MFTALEKNVMALLLEAPVIAEGASLDEQTIRALCDQWSQATLKDREWTGVGFFTEFQLPETIQTVTPLNFELGNVVANISGFKVEAGFLLFVRNGRIACLEGYSTEDPNIVWNEQSTVLKVYRTD